MTGETLDSTMYQKNEKDNSLFKYKVQDNEMPDRDFYDTIQKTIASLQETDVYKNKMLPVELVSALLPLEQSEGWLLDLSKNVDDGVMLIKDSKNKGYELKIPINTLRSIVISE